MTVLSWGGGGGGGGQPHFCQCQSYLKLKILGAIRQNLGNMYADILIFANFCVLKAEDDTYASMVSLKNKEPLFSFL